MSESRNKQNEEPIKEGNIKNLNDNDVLCGRGSGPNDHCGNVAFRELVSTRRKEYLATSTRSQKALIAKEIVNVVWNLQPPGRFLEKVTDCSWNIVPDEKALEKVKQALRQMRHRRLESTDSSSSNELSTESPKRRNSAISSMDLDFPKEKNYQRNTSASNIHTQMSSPQNIGLASYYMSALQVPNIKPAGGASIEDPLYQVPTSSSTNVFPAVPLPSMTNPMISNRHNINAPLSKTSSVSASNKKPKYNTIQNYGNLNHPSLKHLKHPLYSAKNRNELEAQSLISLCKHPLDAESLIRNKYQSSIVFQNKFAKTNSRNIYNDAPNKLSGSIPTELEPQPLSGQRGESTDDITAQEYLNIYKALDDEYS